MRWEVTLLRKSKRCSIWKVKQNTNTLDLEIIPVIREKATAATLKLSCTIFRAIVTDHESLTWLMKQDLPSSRLSRWILQLQAATPFKIVHRPGAANVNADALSRAIPLQQFISSLILIEDEWHPTLQSQQASDEWCKAELATGVAFMEASTNLICKKVKIGPIDRTVILLPKSMVDKVVNEFHEGPTGGHWGTQMTLEILRKRFTWPEMSKDVERIVAGCEV